MRILIADDHEIFRRGLRSLLESRTGWEVCGEASNGKEAVEQALRLPADIIVLDVAMPEMSGLDATIQIMAALPQSKIVILSQHEPALLESAALKAGAKAYLTKADAGQKLISTIERLMTTPALP